MVNANKSPAWSWAAAGLWLMNSHSESRWSSDDEMIGGGAKTVVRQAVARGDEVAMVAPAARSGERGSLRMQWMAW